MKLYKLKNAVSLNRPLIFFVLFCQSVAIGLQAQESKDYDERAHFFAHGGISMSATQGGGASGFSKINFLAGVGVLLPQDDIWRIGIEANIVQKGIRQEAERSGVMIEQYRSNLFYAQLAGYAELQIFEDFSVYLGPGLGYLVSASETDFNGPVTGPSQTNWTDFELSVLGGIKYSPIDHITSYIRFDQSILPVVNTGLSNNNAAGLRQYHTVLALGVIFSL